MVRLASNECIATNSDDKSMSISEIASSSDEKEGKEQALLDFPFN